VVTRQSGEYTRSVSGLYWEFLGTQSSEYRKSVGDVVVVMVADFLSGALCACCTVVMTTSMQFFSFFLPDLSIVLCSLSPQCFAGEREARSVG